MKRLGWLVVLIVSLPALACADDVDFVPRWKMPKSGAKYVKMEGDRLVVDVPAGISNVCAYATAEIDLSGWAQRSFEAEIRCRGERLVRDSRRDRGVKLSLHYVDAAGDSRYPCANAPEEGDFGWTNLYLSVTFGAVPCAKSPRPKVVLGLQQTSGRIEFDLSSLRLHNEPPRYPLVDNDYQVKYPPEVASRGRMRGVMGRGVGKNKERDIEDLKNYGANLIRLQMNGFAQKRPPRKGEKPKTLADWNKWLARCLDDAERVLGMLEERGMMMVLDMHNPPLGGYGRTGDVFYVKEYADRFVEAWREIAVRFKGRKGIYGYDLMNEPSQTRSALPDCDYWNLQRRAAEAIRAVDPDATIVFAAVDSSSPQAFERLVALEMDNVVYQVHMYKPIHFTHQGANGRARPQPGAEIPYPDPERGVDKAMLRKWLQPVRDFQLRHNAKIYAGEFSACIYAPGAGQYLRDCISIFEEYGWDWSYHSFREALWWNVETVIDPKTGKPVPNKDNDRFRALVDGFNFGKQGYDVYLLIGQSNMSGRGTLTADNAVSNDRIVKFTKDMKWAPAEEPLHFDRKHCGAGLAMSFARKMADASPERTIALVPCAVGGTPLRRWCPGGDLYSNAVVRARAALRDGTLKGILWHQGCADANNVTNAETYAARLVAMAAQLRKDLGAEDVPFVAGELPRFLSRYAEKNGHHHHWPVVNAQLAEAVSRIPNAALVSSEGLDDCRKDLIHFETPSLRKFGERYAEAMLKLQLVEAASGKHVR